MKTETLLAQSWFATAHTAHARWMVVDDNQGVLELLGDLLENLKGDEVSRFQSGSDALRAFQSSAQDFQFVVTDLEMPDIDGIELCRRLHAVSPKLKVLLTTGSQIITEVEAMRSGFCGLLPKPFAGDALRKAVERAALPVDHSDGEVQGKRIPITFNQAAPAAA